MPSGRSWPHSRNGCTGCDARPHWGKVFGTAPDVVQRLYPRLPDFAGLRRELDPGNMFGNAMVDRYLSVA